MSAKTFYVYILRDPRPGKNLQPIYVGKGKDGRLRQHWRDAENHYNPLLRGIFSKLHAACLEPSIEIVRSFDAEANAFQLEVELIAKYGRRDMDTGTLCNLTDGGEGASGSLTNAERCRKRNNDPEFAKANVERLRKRNNDPEFAKASAERMKKLHTDPEFAKARDERFRKLYADPEYVKAHAERTSEVMKKRHTDPEYAKAHAQRISELMKKLWADPEFTKEQILRRSESMKKLHADPEFRKANAEHLKRLHADPEFAEARDKRISEHMKKLHADPEYAKVNAKRAKALWADPESRARMSAGIRASWVKRRARKAAQSFAEMPCASV